MVSLRLVRCAATSKTLIWTITVECYDSFNWKEFGRIHHSQSDVVSRQFL
jgi:hypothetical protein